MTVSNVLQETKNKTSGVEDRTVSATGEVAGTVHELAGATQPGPDVVPGVSQTDPGRAADVPAKVPETTPEAVEMTHDRPAAAGHQMTGPGGTAHEFASRDGVISSTSVAGEHHAADPRTGLASLVGGIFEDAQKLVRQEVALALREASDAWEQAKTGAVVLASGFAVFGLGGVLLGFMLAKLLHQYVLPNHEWACFGIVGGVVTLVGAALIARGLTQVKGVHLTLPDTVRSLREDAQAVSDAVTG